MPLSSKNRKQLWFFLLTFYFAVGYPLVNHLSNGRDHYYNVGLPFEANLPFIPLFILGYLLIYPALVGLYFIVKDSNHFSKMVRAFFVLITLHLLFFLLFPVKMELRSLGIEEAGGWIPKLVALNYRIDQPYNCFPSLHVAFVFLGTLLLKNYTRVWYVIYLLATLIISLSVIFVKQHYIADIIGGYITALLVYKFVFQRDRF